MRRVLAAFLVLIASRPALAQTQYTLDSSGAWVAKAGSAPNPDAIPIAEARRLVVDGKPGKAVSILDDWLEAHETSDSPLLPQAYQLRGDATLADGDEYGALYDYEAVCIRYPASEEFVKACERELDIATRYVHGLKRKWLGMRVTGATDVGEELLIRVQERLPGSTLAERANLELADFYYRRNDLKEAAIVYEAYLRWFPHGEHAALAKERRIYCTIGQFRGPAYDASTLADARILIEEFLKDDPDGARRAGLDESMVTRLDESGAVQKMNKVRWYLRRGDPVSARLVLRRLIKEHPQTAAAAEALKMMDERGWTVALPPAAEPTGNGAKPAEEHAPAPPTPRGHTP